MSLEQRSYEVARNLIYGLMNRLYVSVTRTSRMVTGTSISR
jgi:hypothetical protein